MPHVEYDQLADTRSGEPSSAVRERVEATRACQATRLAETSLFNNADVTLRELHLFAVSKSTPAEQLLEAAMTLLHRSARSYHRMLKLSCTLADLAKW